MQRTNSKVMWAQMTSDMNGTGKTIPGRDRADLSSGGEGWRSLVNI